MDALRARTGSMLAAAAALMAGAWPSGPAAAADPPAPSSAPLAAPAQAPTPSPAPKPAKARPPARPPGDSAALNYIVRAEAQWAESLATGATEDVDRILAPDFMGVAPDGTLYDKAAAIAETRASPSEFASNRANEVKVRFYGDTAIAQGSETWQRRVGPAPLRGRFVWTDTWVRRHGKWQVVAAEDVVAPDPAN